MNLVFQTDKCLNWCCWVIDSLVVKEVQSVDQR